MIKLLDYKMISVFSETPRMYSIEKAKQNRQLT